MTGGRPSPPDPSGGVRAPAGASEPFFEGSFDVPLDRLEELLGGLERHDRDDPWVLYGLARLWSIRGKQDLALVVLGRAERRFGQMLPEGSPEAGRARHLTRLAAAVILDRQGLFEQARAAFSEAAGLGGFEAGTVPGGAERRWVEFDRSGMVAFWLRAAVSYREEGLIGSLARAYRHLGLRLLDRGEPLAARGFLEPALQLDRGRGSRISTAGTLAGLGRAERHLGLLDRAGPHLEEAIRIGEEMAHEVLVSRVLTDLAEVRGEEERFEEALELYDRSIALQQEGEDVSGLARSYASRADHCLWRGDPDFALRQADAAVALRVPGTDPIEEARLLSTRARARLAVGLPPGPVAAELEGISRTFQDHDTKGELAVATWWLAASRLGMEQRLEATLAVSRALELVGRYRLEALLARHAGLHPALVEIGLSDPETGDVGRSVQVVARRAAGTAPASVEEGTPLVSARLFGELSVFLGEKEVPVWSWRSKKAVLLLAFLIHHRGDPVHREQAMEALWPDGNPDRARRNLNVALTALRRGLEQVHPRGAECVRRQGTSYRIAPELIDRIDVLEFLDLQAEAAAREALGDREGALGAAEGALELVVGEYLAFEPYAAWAAAERAHLREREVDLMIRVAAWQLEAGRPHEAVRRARRVLEADPFRERAWQVLLRAHLAAGDRAAALAAFRECTTILAAELAVGPGPELVELAERARQARDSE